jgi:prophage regulatory protein
MKGNCPNSAFLRIRDMVEITGMSRSTVWNLSRTDPEFPKARKLSANCTGWKRSEVEKWIENRPISKYSQE